MPLHCHCSCHSLICLPPQAQLTTLHYYYYCIVRHVGADCTLTVCCTSAAATLPVPAGTHFNEMNFGSPPDEALEQRSVVAYKQHVLVGHTDAFNGVATEELLLHLAG